MADAGTAKDRPVAPSGSSHARGREGQDYHVLPVLQSLSILFQVAPQLSSVTESESLSPSPGADREQFARRFAREALGPLSSDWIQTTEGSALLRAKLAAGLDPEDAVLSAVHEHLGQDARLDEEFLGYFLQRLLHVRMVDLYPGLRRYLDTGDLVQSVLGDLWPQLRELEFRDRSSFLALLVTRLRWKATSRRRDLHAAKRREDRRTDGLPIENLASNPPSPIDAQISREETERVALFLFRLPPEDRTAVRLHLSGASSKEIAQELGASVDAARKRLERALEHLRELLGRRS